MTDFFKKPIVKTLMLKGQEGQSIKGITKTNTSGLKDTYTITLTDGTTSTFTVTNGKTISSISKTGTSGLVDTYTIRFNDGTTSTFTVTNGAKGDTGSVENLKIGGVNLLSESSLIKAPSDKSNFSISALNSANYNFKNGNLTVLTNKSGTKNNGAYLAVNNANDIIKPNEKATVSIDLKGENIAFNFAIMFRGEKDHIYDNLIYSDIYVDEDKIDDFTRYSFSFTMPDVGTKDTTLGIVLRQGNFKNNCKIIYRNAQLERGEIATDWTPSLEDIEDTYATKSDVEQKNTALSERIDALEKADTGWQYLYHNDDGYSYVRGREKNGIFYIIGSSGSTGIQLQKNDSTFIENVPNIFWPDKDIIFAVSLKGVEGSASGTITTDGKIQIYSTVATGYWGFCISYPIG